MAAKNEYGWSDSIKSNNTNVTVKSAPIQMTVPVILSVLNKTQIVLSWNQLTQFNETGGSNITLYELQLASNISTNLTTFEIVP